MVTTNTSEDTEVSRELKQLRDDDEVLGIVREHYERIKSDRYQIDWKFRIAEMFYRGDIYARYNKNTRDIETPRPKRGEVRVELPIIKTLVDANVTELVKEKPQWDVLAESYDEEGIKEASWNNLLLDNEWDKNGLSEKAAQVARAGITKSLGILECGWDPDKGKNGGMYYDVVRPEDFYVNPKSNTFEDAPCLIKIISKDIAQIRASELYKAKKDRWWHELKADIDLTENEELKAVQDRDTGTSTSSVGESTRGAVLLAECYYKYYDGTKAKYRIVTFPVKQGSLLLRNEEVETGKMPWFFGFWSDKHDGEIYGQGKVLPIASAVKNYVDLVSKTVRYHQIFTNGTFLVPRGANPQVVDGEAGKIIYYQPGRQITPMQMPQLPASVFQQQESLMNNIMDSAGVHETALGRPPAKIESARGLESLTHGDAQAKAVLKQNFERFLSNVGKYTLLCIAKNMSEEEIVQIYDEDGQGQKFAARGSETFSTPEKLDEFNQYDDTLVVRPKENVKVVVGSGLGNTPEAQYAKAQELRETGLVDRMFVLRAARVGGNIAKLAQKAHKESLEAEEARKEKPPQKETRDYINTKFSDLSKDEQDQLVQQYGIQVGKAPRPSSPEFQADAQDAQLPGKIQLAQAQNEHSALSSIAQAEQESLNPALAGGVFSAPDELQGITQGESQ